MCPSYTGVVMCPSYSPTLRLGDLLWWGVCHGGGGSPSFPHFMHPWHVEPELRLKQVGAGLANGYNVYCTIYAWLACPWLWCVQWCICPKTALPASGIERGTCYPALSLFSSTALDVARLLAARGSIECASTQRVTAPLVLLVVGMWQGGTGLQDEW
jgi:hypothetical protein